MATQQRSKPIEDTATSSCPPPPDWWCKWQALKGTNFRHLTLTSVDLRNRAVVITGSNSGIGREAALQFARWGANVILGCREPPPHEMHPSLVVEECKSAALAAGYDKSWVKWWTIDMANLKSIEAFGKRLIDEDLSIDILVNNAGMAAYAGEPRFTGDGFEIVHQVNFLSHVLLTMTVLPCLSKAKAPRIICTTSCMQYFGEFNLDNANSGRNSYSNNKLYFQTWLTELQHRMSKCEEYAHITIHGVHPGYVKTNIWESPRNDQQSAKTDSSKTTSWFGWALTFLSGYISIDAQQGSLCITNAATGPAWSVVSQNSQEDKNVGRLGGGRYFNRIWDEDPMPQTRDVGCRHMVWDFVNRELGLEKRSLLYSLGA